MDEDGIMAVMAPKKPAKRARERGDVVAMGLELNAKLAAALDAHHEKTRLPKRAIIEIALEEYLARQNPPSAD